MKKGYDNLIIINLYNFYHFIYYFAHPKVNCLKELGGFLEIIETPKKIYPRVSLSPNNH